MQFKPLAAALVGSLLGLAAAEPAAANESRYARPSHTVGAPHADRHGLHLAQQLHRRQARMLPPDIPYRDPSVDLRPRGRPDFLIRSYLPRYTNAPMYNEPPARFPER